MTAGLGAPVIVLVATATILSGCGSRGADPGSFPGRAGTVRAVTDMRSVTVQVPATLTRVATIDDGFVESVMTRLGVIRTLVATGSSGLQQTWSYAYPLAGKGEFVVDGGMSTMRALHPWLAELPCATPNGSDAISYETIVSARPQVVVLRVGDCTLGTSADSVVRSTSLLEAMGIPVVVLRSPADYRQEGLKTLREEILVLGRLFSSEREAGALADELATTEAMIRSRVGGVPADRRPRVLYLGLASGARASGGAAYVWGTDTAESWMLEHIVAARNAYRGLGARVLLNAEQVLSLDPDVIFLPTSAGYHPPRELAEAPYFGDLRRLRAVRDGRVYAMPWSPLNCARRVEYPVDLMIMAKGTYPELFRDVAVRDWVLEFYRRTYHIDEAQARLLRRSQWLEWTVDAGF